MKSGDDFVIRVRPDTIAKSLAIGNPADGIYAVEAVKNSGGCGEYATDQEVVEAIQLLATTEGIFTETAGGVTLAVTKKLIQNQQIQPGDSVVVAITGNGMKTIEALDGKVTSSHQIAPQLKAFRELMHDI